MPKGYGYGGPIKGNNYSGTALRRGSTISGSPVHSHGKISPTGYASDGGGVNVRAKPSNASAVIPAISTHAVGDGKSQGFGGYGKIR